MQKCYVETCLTIHNIFNTFFFWGGGGLNFPIFFVLLQTKMHTTSNKDPKSLPHSNAK